LDKGTIDSLVKVTRTAWYKQIQLALRGFSGMTRRRITPVAVPAVLVAFLIFWVYSYLTAETPWSWVFPPLSIPQRNVVGHGVVLLTGVTYERLAAFAEVDDFYSKLWRNRLGYAAAHGIYPSRLLIA
jgi:hypothetical protein